MDIVDVIVAKALSPQGQVEQYAAQARQAAINANNAVNAANDAVETADLASSELNELLNQFQSSVSAVAETEINKIDLESINKHTANKESIDLLMVYDGENLSRLSELIKYYNTTGQNTDGSMTQKAITDALKTLENKINNSGGGSNNNINFDPEDAGKIVIVNNDGTIIPSNITVDNLLEILFQSSSYIMQNTVGLEIDYANKTFTRIQEAANKNSGYDFDQYSMYGGRKRCNVEDNGMITAFYGDPEYTEDGSNGQVMVYQPKFYYKRLILTDSEKANGGKVIQKEQILISPVQQIGFKLHPLFITPEGEELEYVLLSAYEGSAYKVNTDMYDTSDSSDIVFSMDKLSSVSNTKPISGVNKNFTIANAEQMAQNRGSNWHITNIAAESALQMLELVEFGSLNMQNALELGVVNITNDSRYNCSSLTGSTSILGNATGHADETINEINGSYFYYNTNGKRAISYRGTENPWGNIWRMIGGVNIVGNGDNNGGMPYICTDFNYATTTTNDNYEPLNFYLPGAFDWISRFGYNNDEYDWIFIPTECSGANSALPIGDNLWTQANLNGINMCMIGGAWSFNDSCGPFYYACDKSPSEAAKAYSARLMCIPEKNETYVNNIIKWLNKMGE